MTERIPWPSGDPRPPLLIHFRIDDGGVHVVARDEGRGDRGMALVTWRLSDGSTITATVVPKEIPGAVFLESDLVEIDAGARIIWDGRYDVYPYEIHIRRP